MAEIKIKTPAGLYSPLPGLPCHLRPRSCKPGCPVTFFSISAGHGHVKHGKVLVLKGVSYVSTAEQGGKPGLLQRAFRRQTAGTALEKETDNRGTFGKNRNSGQNSLQMGSCCQRPSARHNSATRRGIETQERQIDFSRKIISYFSIYENIPLDIILIIRENISVRHNTELIELCTTTGFPRVSHSHAGSRFFYWSTP